MRANLTGGPANLSEVTPQTSDEDSFMLGLTGGGREGLQHGGALFAPTTLRQKGAIIAGEQAQNLLANAARFLIPGFGAGGPASFSLASPGGLFT